MLCFDALDGMLTRVFQDRHHVSHYRMPYESNVSDILASSQRPEKLLQQDFRFFGRECLRLSEDGRSQSSIRQWAADVNMTLYRSSVILC